MSSRIWSAACAIVLGASVGVLAQESPAPQAGAAQSAAAKKITVSGCVAKAEAAQTPTGTAGAAGAGASEKAAKFVLQDASMAPGGTAGTAGAPTTSIASQYKLDGDDAKLTPHVGHKVEITGTVAEAKGATEAPAASAANAPTLKVDSVKMVAPSCK
jgi:hypothetical protein